MSVARQRAFCRATRIAVTQAAAGVAASRVGSKHVVARATRRRAECAAVKRIVSSVQGSTTPGTLGHQTVVAFAVKGTAGGGSARRCAWNTCPPG